MSERELREIVDQYRPPGGILEQSRVDRAGRRIENAALLGRVSQNNRVYSDQALSDGARLYAGAPMYLDHPTERELRARDGVRSVRDLAGRVVNPRVVGDQVRGDLELLDVEEARIVLALAEQAPTLAGMSHRATGDVKVDQDGTQIVESLSQVHSLDLVSEPATVGGLMESIERQDRREEIEEVVLEATGGATLAGLVADHLADEEDGLERAEEFAEEFKAKRPASGEGKPRTRRRRFGPRLLERDPDDLIERDRGHRNGNGNGRGLGTISDDLFV